MANDKTTSTIERVANVRLGSPFVSDNGTRDGYALGMAELAYLYNHPEHAMNQLVEVECPGRPNPDFGSKEDKHGPRIACERSERVRCRALFASFTACDECRRAAEEYNLMFHCKTEWEKKCPSLYRDTKRSHDRFPKAQFEATRDFTGERSYVFFGPSGSGKTRLAFLLLKRAMIFGNKTIGVMFDEQLADAKASRERMKAVEQWGGFNVLLMDDALMTAHDEHTTAFLKSLLDYIMRRKGQVIITTQITRGDYMEQLRKFETSQRKTTRTDDERVAAVWRRISELCGEPIEFHGVPGTEPGPGGTDQRDKDLPF